jgi:BirA family transcriptional regulator, biotin operon repressor / biotin---[acetyl-CoA-carboxylase] ligase
MPVIKYPTILTDLGHVGETGLPMNPDPWFQRELEMCRENGFELNFADGKVSLKFNHDVLVPYWIQKETPVISWDWLRVNGFQRLDSTNRQAIHMAADGAPSGTLVYAEEQTAGKGRMGRSWHSPAGAGLYFSIIIRPRREFLRWPLLTHTASAALVKTLMDLGNHVEVRRPLDIDLKWPNDVLLSGKKCAGILLETLPLDGENQAAVIGIGINVRKESVPEYLADEASCLDDMTGITVPRRRLLVLFLEQFQLCHRMFENGEDARILEQWKRMSSMWNETPVWIHEGDSRRPAVTRGLDENGALIVVSDNGVVETLLAGDIRIRKNE